MGVKEFPSYQQLSDNRTERRVQKLASVADVVINTEKCTKKDLLVRVAGHLGLYGREVRQLVDVLVGGQFGSEGKGQIVQYLAPEYDFIIRVGGPNAGHTVYEEPKPYIFHQLPSGTRSSEARLLIGPGGYINVLQLMREISDCKVNSSRLVIDPQAMIIETRDRKKEDRLVSDIGSTGQGVGSATARRVLERGKKDSKGTMTVRLAKDIRELKPFLKETNLVLERAFYEGKRVLLEGTQGTGLSLYHGKYPYVTSRDTTVAGCVAEAGISPKRVRNVVMVCRTYPIRVQSPPRKGKTSGRISQEINFAVISERSGIPLSELQTTETTSTTQRKRRVGEFDWELLRRSASLNSPTDIALTFADYLTIENRKARRFEQLKKGTIYFIEEIERVAGAPVSLISTRFHSRSIIDRRAW